MIVGAPCAGDAQYSQTRTILKPSSIGLVEAAPELAPVAKFAHDDTTPIPRPSTYFGREYYHDIREENDALMRQAARVPAAVETSPTRRPASPPAEPEMTLADPETMLSPVAPQAPMQRIDKAALPLGEPKRIRDKEHLKFVARQPCLVCGRQPAGAHHLRFAQSRALSMKVSDEFTVPLCRTHHRNLHQAGNELTWWEKTRHRPTADGAQIVGDEPSASGSKNGSFRTCNH